MANVSKVNGFRPVRHLDGSPWNGQVERFAVLSSDGTAIFQGDLVTLAAGQDATGTPVVTKASAVTTAPQAIPVVGVAVGFAINPLNLNSPQYRPAGVATYALVSTSPDVLYEVQSSIVISDSNSNVIYQDSNGSTVTGMSGENLYSVTGTTAATTLKLMGAVQRSDNDVTSVNAKYLVMINNHQYSGGTGTGGV